MYYISASQWSFYLRQTIPPLVIRSQIFFLLKTSFFRAPLFLYNFFQTILMAAFKDFCSWISFTLNFLVRCIFTRGKMLSIYCLWCSIYSFNWWPTSSISFQHSNQVFVASFSRTTTARLGCEQCSSATWVRTGSCRRAFCSSPRFFHFFQALI